MLSSLHPHPGQLPRSTEEHRALAARLPLDNDLSLELDDVLEDAALLSSIGARTAEEGLKRLRSVADLVDAGEVMAMRDGEVQRR